MSLSKFITERLKITSKTRSLKQTEHTLFPKDRKELQEMIEDELEAQGPDADLNHIDVSKVTNMRGLFSYKQIGNIKIDEWDTSNVTTMEGMFKDCQKFNADLSRWDVSKVTDMYAM